MLEDAESLASMPDNLGDRVASIGSSLHSWPLKTNYVAITKISIQSSSDGCLLEYMSDLYCYFGAELAKPKPAVSCLPIG